MNPSRQRLFKSLLAAWVVLGAVVIGALAAEVVLRDQRRRSRSAVEVYREQNVFAVRWAALGVNHTLWLRRFQRYRPNAVLRLGEYVVETNSLGYRTPEFSLEKPPGRLRVVAIGGSTTFQGRTNETTYPAVLERLLRERFRGREIEVLNLGISGSLSGYWLRDDEDSPVEGRRRVDRLLELEPDLVIQYNAANDIVRRHLGRYADAHALRTRLLRHSFLLQRLISVDLDAFDPAFDETIAHFREIRRLSRERGAEYLVATFAAPDETCAPADFRSYLDLTTEEWTRGALRYYREYARLLERFNDRLVAWAAAGEVPLVELHATLRRPELFLDICHLDDEGTAEMAAALVDSAAELLVRSEGWERGGAPRASRP